MNPKLWMATFEPAYPVCEGRLIFVTPEEMQEAEARTFANFIVEGYGRPDIQELDYLGEFIPSVDFLMDANESYDGVYIMSIQTGEY